MTTLEMVATVMCCCGIVQLLRTVTSFDPCHPWHLVVLAQLVELSHPTSEIRGSNTFSSIKCIAKTKRKKKMQGMAHFFKKARHLCTPKRAQMKNILRVVKRLGLSRAQKHLNRIRSKTSHLAVLMGDQWSQIHVEEPESYHFRHQVITLNQLTIQSLKF